ncbi:SWIM-type domain-containing protein, partial [Aphis craccivora]
IVLSARTDGRDNRDRRRRPASAAARRQTDTAGVVGVGVKYYVTLIGMLRGLHKKCVMYSENQQDFESSVKEIREEDLKSITKEGINGRTKAYNAVALVDFIVHVGEEYFTLRLLDYAHGRYRETHRLYSKLCSKMSDIKKDDIKQFDTNTYTIPSQSDSTIIYSINTEIGVCSCKSGISGAFDFCKHQAWVHHELKIQLPNSFAITMKERYALGKLALGDKCPPPKFFLGLKEQLITSINENRFIHSVNKTAASLNSRRGKIGVQHTSIRVTRGSKRVPSGRRPKKFVTKVVLHLPYFKIATVVARAK